MRLEKKPIFFPHFSKKFLKPISFIEMFDVFQIYIFWMKSCLSSNWFFFHAFEGIKFSFERWKALFSSIGKSIESWKENFFVDRKKYAKEIFSKAFFPFFGGKLHETWWKSVSANKPQIFWEAIISKLCVGWRNEI